MLKYNIEKEVFKNKSPTYIISWCLKKGKRTLPEITDYLCFLRDKKNDSKYTFRLLKSLCTKGLVEEKENNFYLTDEGIVNFDRLQDKKLEKISIKKEDKTEERTSSLITKEHIIEQVFKNGKNLFCIYETDTDTWNFSDRFETEDTLYLPIDDEEVKKGAVLLPSEPLEYETTRELDKEIQTHIHRWLDVPKTFEKMATWQVRLSWLYDKFHTLNYTRAIGDWGTGKTRFLNTIGYIHYKPMVVAGALTPAVIFRIINKWKGTLLIDEGDQADSDAKNSFVKILNCGYEKGQNVARCDRIQPNKLDFFYVFGPKVITTRKRFDDKAVESRCMTTTLFQTTRLDIKDILTKSFFDHTLQLRNKLLLYRFRNYHKIDPEAGLNVKMENYEPRLRQVNRAFLSLFAHDFEQVKLFKEYLDDYQKDLIEERSESFDGCIVQAIANFIVNGNNNITCSDIKEYLDQNFSFPYDYSVRTIGKHIRNLGLELKAKLVFGNTKKVIFLDKIRLETLFKRYIFDDDLLAKLITKNYRITVITDITQRERENKKEVGTDEKVYTNFNELSQLYGNNSNLVILKGRPTTIQSKIEYYLEYYAKYGVKIIKEELIISHFEKKGFKDEEIFSAIDRLISQGMAIKTPKGLHWL